MSERARGYQMRTDARCVELLGQGRKPLVVCPTGGGKTYMARMRLREARRPLAITHTRTLLGQTQENIPETMVLMLQGILAKGPQGAARRELVKQADLIWVDEAHHPVGPEWIQLAAVMGDAPAFGSTATPQRADGRPLSGFWTDLVVSAQYSELLALGHLCPCDIAEPDISRKQQREMKVRPDGVASYLTGTDANGVPLGRRSDGSWRPAIHTDQTIAQCQTAVERYSAAGVIAVLVTCDTGDDDRQNIFDQFSAGWIDVLVSPMALAEGFDSPRAEVLVSQRTFAHMGTYVQWCGRILRPYGEREVDKWAAKLSEKGIEMRLGATVYKKRALFIDTTDAASVHGPPTSDRAYSLDGKGMTLAEEDEEEKPPPPQQLRQPMVEVDAKYTIVRDTVVEHYLKLEEMALAAGHKPGWAYYELKSLGRDPPRAMEAKYPSTCRSCGRKVRARTPGAKGETILWAGAGHAYHRDCFFASLTKAQLEREYSALDMSGAQQ